MKRLIAAGLSLGMACGAAAEGNVKTKTPASPLNIAAVVRFTPPAGWTPVEYANGVDPVLRFEKLSDAVQIRVFGARGSDYPTPKDFLAGPAATEEGAAPAPDGTVTVAGKKLALYRRRFSTGVSNPHGPASPKAPMGVERFCVLPLKDGRFAVLAYRRSTPAPDLEGKGEKAWAAFLKTVKPR
ncbi:MAG: hypothetical protein Q7J64_01490 [Elusimicrobiota bacterium]|nr:hypothetical protein [Elusimicrobiota bacterium]